MAMYIETLNREQLIEHCVKMRNEYDKAIGKDSK